METRAAFNESGCYQIRVKSILDSKWSDWFDGFTVTQINGDSLLTGYVKDQAALHGVINKIRDLGLTLIFIKPLDSEKNERSGEYDENK
jgi:hypothetical protein